MFMFCSNGFPIRQAMSSAREWLGFEGFSESIGRRFVLRCGTKLILLHLIN
jgi:hypothetical protein